MRDRPQKGNESIAISEIHHASPASEVSKSSGVHRERTSTAIEATNTAHSAVTVFVSRVSEERYKRTCCSMAGPASRYFQTYSAFMYSSRGLPSAHRNAS